MRSLSLQQHAELPLATSTSRLTLVYCYSVVLLLLFVLSHAIPNVKPCVSKLSKSTTKVPDAEGVSGPAQEPHQGARVRALGRNKRHRHREYVTLFGAVHAPTCRLLRVHLCYMWLLVGWLVVTCGWLVVDVVVVSWLVSCYMWWCQSTGEWKRNESTEQHKLLQQQQQLAATAEISTARVTRVAA